MDDSNYSFITNTQLNEKIKPSTKFFVQKLSKQ
jgi:hypothetical protein